MGSPGPNTSVRFTANSPAGPSRIQAALQQQQQQGNELRRRHTASHTPTAPPAPTLGSRLQSKPSGNLSLMGGGASDAANASVSGEGDNSFATAPASVNHRPHQPAGPMQRRELETRGITVLCLESTHFFQVSSEDDKNPIGNVPLHVLLIIKQVGQCKIAS